MTLRILDTFSGIGGFSLAARWLGGFETVQFVEWDPYCQRILSKNFPSIPIHGDITTFHPAEGAADVVCGGFPCQDISVAGKQAGIKQGTRSGLFYELMRVICVVRPQYVVLENVAAILANGLDTVLGELAEAGFDAEWACIPASAVGACHQRDRWWLVAYANNSDITARKFEHKQQGQTIATDGSGNGNAPYANSFGVQRSKRYWAHRAPWSQTHFRCLSPSWQQYESEPVLRRGDDGLSNRVDRLKALGNSVVPQVAMIPLRRVLDLHHAKC